MKIETKFNIGDEPFFMRNGKIITARVYRVTSTVSEGYEKEPRNYYTLRQNSMGNYIDHSLSESEMFNTKTDLLNTL